jgi:glutathione S-transferase
VPQIAQWGETNKTRVADFLPILDRQLAACRFVAGETYSVADITALVTVDFSRWIKMPVPDEHQHLRRWHAQVSARPSAKA